MSLEGEVCLVTGASRGIGQAIARELGECGATVIGTATTEQGAENITTEFAPNGSNVSGLMLNVNDPTSVVEVVKVITNIYGPITVLVNNAGVTQDNLLMRMKDEQWETIINTNLSSVYRMSKACLRGMMKAKRGRIVNISSVVALTGNPGQSNYAAAKAGMIGFTKSLAREVGSRGITVNTVAPGFVDTDMTRALPEEQRDALLRQIPLNRLGQAQDIAKAVAFLASAEASYITGETLNINGGMFMP